MDPMDHDHNHYDDFDDNISTVHSAASPAGSDTTDDPHPHSNVNDPLDVSTNVSSAYSSESQRIEMALSAHNSARSGSDQSYVSSEEEYAARKRKKNKKQKKSSRHRGRPPSPIEEVDESMETDEYYEDDLGSTHHVSSSSTSSQQWHKLVGNHATAVAGGPQQSALSAYNYDTPHHGGSRTHRNLLVPTRSNRSNSSVSTAQSNNSGHSISTAVSTTVSSSTVPMPTPADCPLHQLQAPLPEDEESYDDEVIGIPKFEAEFDEDSEPESEDGMDDDMDDDFDDEHYGDDLDNAIDHGHDEEDDDDDDQYA